MRKLTTVLALGCMALLAQPTLACDEAKTVGADKQCGVTATAVALASTDCPIESAMGSLAAALEAMNASGQTDIPGRDHLIAAALQLAKMKPEVAHVQFAKFSGGGECGSQKASSVVAKVSTPVGTCGTTAKQVVAKVNQSECSSTSAKAVVANVKSSDCATACEGKAKAVVANVKSSDCATACEGKAKAVVANVKSSDCATACEGKAKAVVANVKSSDCATACEGKAKAVVANVKSSDCATACEGKAKAVVANVKSGDGCCSSSKAKNVVANVKSGEGCCESSKAKAIVANVKSGECSSAKNAQFIAYGCEKSDSIAQAAAKAYLEVMSAIQTVAGQEGCPAETAHNVLTAVVERMQAEYAQAQAKSDILAAPATVSFGALSENNQKSGSSCSSKN